MQGAASPDPATVYVDARALCNDRVTLVEKGAPHSTVLMESGKVDFSLFRISNFVFENCLGCKLYNLQELAVKNRI